MKRIIISIVALISILSFSGCEEGRAVSTQTKGDFKVEFLFEQDGIKVYRFSDKGYTRYFTTRGDTMWQQQSGKTSYPDGITSGN